MFLKATVLKCGWAFVAIEDQRIQGINFEAAWAFSSYEIGAAVRTRLFILFPAFHAIFAEDFFVIGALYHVR